MANIDKLGGRLLQTRNFFHRDSSREGLVAQAEEHQPDLPFVTKWTDTYPSTTYIDEKTGLKTTVTEGGGEIPDSMTIYDIYRDRAERMPNDPLYVCNCGGGKWETHTASETLADIRALAKGFMRAGIEKGMAVGFMCKTRYEWNIIDAALVSIGGIVATIYDTDSAEQIRTIVDNSDAAMLIVETKEMREKAEFAVKGVRNFKGIYCIATGAVDEIKAYGETVSDNELDERIAAVTKKDLCSIVYTSGSTAAPKGVEMTHEDYCTDAVNLPLYLPDILADKRGSILMFLPQAHSFARAINYIVVASNMRIYIAESFKSLLTDLQVARPTALIGVPRVYEKIYNAASQKAGHGLSGRIFAMGAKNARAYAREMNRKGRPSIHTAIPHAFYDAAIFSQIRSVLGGRAKWLVCGGAPADPAMIDFFHGAGINLCEGYGLTETTAPCAFMPYGAPTHPGSVGSAFPGFALRISKEGEIQVKGNAVFVRYHKNKQATKDSFTADGWYSTGDLGHLTNDGTLFITGRKKDLIITAGGKNVSPGPLEDGIKRCPLVSNAVVIGDQRPFVSALITLDEDGLRSWLRAKRLDENMPMAEAAANAAVRAEIQKYVDKANAEESRAESVRKFIVLPEDFTQANGLMTASMKIIRPKVIERRYRKLLNTQMYGSTMKK